MAVSEEEEAQPGNVRKRENVTDTGPTGLPGDAEDRAFRVTSGAGWILSLPVSPKQTDHPWLISG